MGLSGALPITDRTRRHEATIRIPYRNAQKHYPEVSEAERQRRVAEFMVNPSKLQAAFVEMEKNMYVALCRQYRIYCLTQDPASPLMWGHYAASHTGICLEFDARRDPFTAVEKVEYRTSYPARNLPTMG